MRGNTLRVTVAPFAVTTALGAFLVFQVQPVISKAVLPWYGGSPAVWTTCMLFFQVLLFGGYLYAHALTTFVRPMWQGLIHVAVLCAALLSLPIAPSADWKPIDNPYPVAHLLALLTAHVGLPYFVLSSTGPLVQAWLTRQTRSDGVYRLYALSNAGSLLALLSYPFLVEPWLETFEQSRVWSLLFCAYALVQGLIAVRTMRSSPPQITGAGNLSSAVSEPSVREDSPWRVWGWLLLPAFASVMLLTITNHVSQEVAVIPFLWIVPLSLYLVTFIVCFDRPSWYRAKWFSTMTIALLFLLPVVMHGPLQGSIVAEFAVYLSLMFTTCMLCHGELARLKPAPRDLTRYYATMSGGGALGGIVVGVVCPIVFKSYMEFPLSLGLSAALALVLFSAHRRWNDSDFDLRRARSMIAGSSLLIIALLGVRAMKSSDGIVASERNFFGVLRVARLGNDLGMLHGKTVHGLQLHARSELVPTTYYAPHSGLGRLMRVLDHQPRLRVGAVGLGVGTVAAYGRPGDQIDFIEINPAVATLAREHFDFLNRSRAQVEILIGDGRLVLEEMHAEPYDLLILDAFSSDAIPAHLLTREAMDVYEARVSKQGVMAFHVTNLHLELAPVVHRLAKEIGWDSRELIAPADPSFGAIESRWVVLTANPELWKSEELSGFVEPDTKVVNQAPLWTDQFHDLLSVFVL